MEHGRRQCIFRFGRSPRECPRGAENRLSQRNGVAENALPNLLAKAASGDDIHFLPQQFFELPLQPSDIEQTSALVEIDEEIDIALGVAFATSHRPEDTHVARAAAFGKREDLRTPRGSEFGQSHTAPVSVNEGSPGRRGLNGPRRQSAADRRRQPPDPNC